MILMRGSILDENVKKGVGGLYLLYLLPTRSEEKEKFSLSEDIIIPRESISMPKPVNRA